MSRQEGEGGRAAVGGGGAALQGRGSVLYLIRERQEGGRQLGRLAFSVICREICSPSGVPTEICHAIVQVSAIVFAG